MLFSYLLEASTSAGRRGRNESISSTVYDVTI